VRFHERIRLAGDLIEEDHLSDILDRCLAANGPEAITYFEITTAAAFVAFAETPADMTLLEVGLGGRLDATNVVEQPRASRSSRPSTWTTSSSSATRWPRSPAKRPGIIKRGVPVVVGRQQDDALEVIEECAARLGAPILAHGQHWHVWEERGRLVFQDETGLLDLPLPACPARIRSRTRAPRLPRCAPSAMARPPARPPCGTPPGPPACSACARVP
jgi:dihydrofolate synthase/folylpolyglutamate synthase